jgi:hypothetical protein
LKNSLKLQDPGFCQIIWDTIYREYEADPDKMEIPKEIERPPKDRPAEKQEVKKKESEMDVDEVKFSTCLPDLA